MLSIGAMGGGQAGYYLGLAREDYYLSGGEPQGVWFGGAVSLLGLPELVEPDHLYNLFDGLSPDGSRQLVQIQQHEGKNEHRPGWDLTFSAPKSVSALWSQCSPEIRQQIQEAHFESVQAALQFLEDSSVLTRRGSGGRRQEPAKALVATFEHGTSRAQDPQLHTHALLLNIGVREDGTTGTLSSLSVFQAKMAAGALYRANLATTLSEKLGLEIEAEGSAFRVKGVPQRLCEFFSKRRQEIERAMEAEGVTTAAGAAKVAVETREAKTESSRSELFSEWQRQGESHGFGTEQAARLITNGRGRFPDIKSSLEEGAKRLMAEGAHFSEIELVRRLAEAGQTRGLKAEDIRRTVGQLIDESEDVIRLGRNRPGVHYTFAQVLRDEDKFFKVCQELNEKTAHMLKPTKVEEAIKTANKKDPAKQLLKEQEDAVRWLTQGTGDVAMMDGIAGSGKTLTLATAARAWEDAGYTVKGLALSGRAARELSQKAEIECTTVAKALYELEKMPLAVRWHSEAKRFYFDFQGCQFELDKKTILIVDEAGMVNTSHFLQLATACQEAGAKLVAVGDPRQLQAIEGASPFSEMIERFGSAALDLIMRQKADWAKAAVRDLADGKAMEAMAKFAAEGLVTLTKTQAEARDALFKEWNESPTAVKDKLILTDRREDAKQLNKMAQEARKSELGITWITVDETTLYMGDRVAFTKTSQARGVNNGDRGTLVAINPLPGMRAATIKLDSGEKVSVNVDQFPHINLGYASTTHRAQGETVREAYVLTGSTMQDKHLAYVQGSRAEEKTHFFLTETEAGAELSEIVKRMSRDRQRTTARQELEKSTRDHPQRGLSR